MAWGMFSIIPCPYRGWKEEARGHMLVCFPLVGVCIGGIWYGVFAITGMVPIYLRTILIALVPWFFTGYMHLDGYMDVCDAVMSRRDLETRQKILKDSRVGAFAVISIGILILAQAGSVLTILEKADYKVGFALFLIPVASRISAALAVTNLKPMHTSQYASMTPGQGEKNHKHPKGQFTMLLLVMLLGCLAVFAISISLGLTVLVTMVVYWIAALYGYRMLAGMNGDISGYALTLGELAGLVALAIVF